MSRRRLMFGGAALACAAMAPAGLLRPAFADAGRQAISAISADEALHQLMDGNGRFIANKPAPRDLTARRLELVTGQSPIAAVVGCADSRVSPDLCFDQPSGNLFVVRVAGNVADDDGLASLEYAVLHLGVPLILVLGHTGCGAVAAAVQSATEGGTLPGHLPGLIAGIMPAVNEVRQKGRNDIAGAAVVANAVHTAQVIRDSSAVLAPAVASGKIKVAAGVYDLASGKVELV